jgi:hypothetical protein
MNKPSRYLRILPPTRSLQLWTGCCLLLHSELSLHLSFNQSRAVTSKGDPVLSSFAALSSLLQMWPGSCLLLNSTSSSACEGQGRAWFSHGCPNRYGWWSLAGLGLYIAAFAPGMGPVPWAVNSGKGNWRPWHPTLQPAIETYQQGRQGERIAFVLLSNIFKFR